MPNHAFRSAAATTSGSAATSPTSQIFPASSSKSSRPALFINTPSSTTPVHAAPVSLDSKSDLQHYVYNSGHRTPIDDQRQLPYSLGGPVIVTRNQSSGSVNSILSSTSSVPHTPRNQIMDSPTMAAGAAANGHLNYDHNGIQGANPSGSSSINGSGHGFTRFNNYSGLSIATSDEEERGDPNADHINGNGQIASPPWTSDEDQFLMAMYHDAIDNPLRSPVLLQGTLSLPYGLVHRVVRNTVKAASQRSGRLFPHSLADTRKRLHYLYSLERDGAFHVTPSNGSTNGNVTSSTSGKPPSTRSNRLAGLRNFGIGDQFDFSEDNRMQNIGPQSQPQQPLSASLIQLQNQSQSPAHLHQPQPRHLQHSFNHPNLHQNGQDTNVSGNYMPTLPPAGINTVFPSMPVQTPPSPPGIGDYMSGNNNNNNNANNNIPQQQESDENSDMRLQSPWLPKEDSRQFNTSTTNYPTNGNNGNGNVLLNHLQPPFLNIRLQRQGSASSSTSSVSSSSEKRALLAETEGQGLGLGLGQHVSGAFSYGNNHSDNNNGFERKLINGQNGRLGPTLSSTSNPHANATNSFENNRNYLTSNYDTTETASNNGSVMSLSSDPFLDSSINKYHSRISNDSDSIIINNDEFINAYLDDDEELNQGNNRNTLTGPIGIPGLVFNANGSADAEEGDQRYRYSSDGHRYRIDGDGDMEILDDDGYGEGNRNTLTAPIDIPGVSKPEDD